VLFLKHRNVPEKYNKLFQKSLAQKQPKNNPFHEITVMPKSLFNAVFRAS